MENRDERSQDIESQLYCIINSEFEHIYLYEAIVGRRTAVYTQKTN